MTDGEERSALAVVRSLGREGYRCIVCSTTGASIAGASRYCALEYRLPSPSDRPQHFAAAVIELVEGEQIDLLLPITEGSLLAVLPLREALDCVTPFPSLQAFQRICDKREVLEVAQKVGIQTPTQTIMLKSDCVPRQRSFPVVVKPSRSLIATDGGEGLMKTSVTWAASQQELAKIVPTYPRNAYPLLLQQAVEGPGVGVFVLIWGSSLRAIFCHRRVREKPPSGGVSVVRESLPLDPSLVERSLDLLKALDWQGVAMVEYKIDSKTGTPFLMEINGRFWGSLQLAIDAGVDFPRLLADVSLNGADFPGSAPSSYKKIRSRWIMGDLDHLIARWRGPDATLRSRLIALLQFIGEFARSRPEVLRLTDLGPFVTELKQWIRAVLAR